MPAPAEPALAHRAELAFDLGQRGLKGLAADGTRSSLREDIFALQVESLLFAFAHGALRCGQTPRVFGFKTAVGARPPVACKAFAICSSTDLLSQPRAISSFYECFPALRPAQ